jgi:hypothetical protein
VNKADIHPLVLHGYGLVEAAYETTVDRFGTYARGDQSQMSVAGSTTDVAAALDHLARLTLPATRLVVVDRGPWTAILTNHRTGSDFNDHQFWAAERLGVRTVRVVDSDARWWKRGNLRERIAYEARIFELHEPDNSTLRSIVCADDGGRWVFETSGSALPIEALFSSGATRKKHRFTRANLREILESAGPGSLTADGLLAAPRFALLEDRITDAAFRSRVETAACSRDEADDPAFGYFQRGMGYVPYMATHATSVIADFERAVAINPAYEPRVRDHLREAHRINRAQRDPDAPAGVGLIQRDKQ